MNNEFLKYYQDNLKFFRKLSADFAKEFPKIASRLELTATSCQDPYVERLLEGAAFLAARVEKKLDDGNIRLLESLLNTIAPQLLSPTPAFAVIQMKEIDESAALQCPEIPLGQQFRVWAAESNTPCTFTAFLPQTIYPVQLKKVQYLTRELPGYGIQTAGGIKFEFELSGPVPDSDEGDLLLYLDMSGDDCSELQRQLQVDVRGVYVQNGDAGSCWEEVSGIRFTLPFFDNEELPLFLRGKLRGLRMVSMAGHFPAYMQFCQIKGFRRLLKKARNRKLVFTAAFSRRADALEHGLAADNFLLNCLPVINLFHKHSDRNPIVLEHECQVVPDRAAPLDYEIFRIESIALYGKNNEKIETLQNAYADYLRQSPTSQCAIFNTHREARLCRPEHPQRSSYAGSEVFVSISSQLFQQYAVNELTFSAEMICSNRDLTLRLVSQNELIPVEKCAAQRAVFVTLPTRPRMSDLNNNTGELWEKMAAMSMHFSTLLWQDGAQPLRIFRDIIRQHSGYSEEETRLIVNGITKFSRTPKTFRFRGEGGFYCEQGWKISLELDEPCFTGLGYYRTGCLLRELLFSYFPINMHVEFEITTVQQGRITSWII